MEKVDKAAERRSRYLSFGKYFMQVMNRPPARIDWRGENVKLFRSKHGVEYPTARQIETAFGSWGDFTDALGVPSGNPKIDVSRLATKFMREEFAMVEEDSHMGSVDGLIENRTVEIKGATLSIDPTFGHIRWRFRLHHRIYSKLVDELWFIGIYEGKVLMAWKLNKSDMVRFADNRDAISLSAISALKGKHYPLAYNEAYRKKLTLTEIDNLIKKGSSDYKWRPSGDRSRKESSV